jgi:hypothetical protein
MMHIRLYIYIYIYLKFLGFLGRNQMHSLLVMFDFVVDEIARLC